MIMKYLFNEIKHTLLVTDKPLIHGVGCPVRLEVSIFSDGTVFVSEIMETPQGKMKLNSSHHHSWKEFKECFNEAANLIVKTTLVPYI
jgi:hypothetical protein